MFADTLRVGTGKPVGRKAKGTFSRRPGFLTERLLPVETAKGITPQMAEELRGELEACFRKDFPRADSFNTPEEAIRRYCSLSGEYGRPASRVILQDGRIHLHESLAIAYADEFRTLPIDFTYRLREPFGTLVRQTLRLITRSLGLMDIRDSYYYSIMEDVDSDYYHDGNGELDRERYDDYSDEEVEYRNGLHQLFQNYKDGEAGVRLDEFKKLPCIDFSRLRAYKPARKEKPLHDILLRAEEVFRGSEPLTRHTGSVRCYLQTEYYPDECVILDNILTYTYGIDQPLIDEYDTCINSELDSGYEIDAVEVDVRLSPDGNESSSGTKSKLEEEINYFNELMKIIDTYE